MTEEGKKYLDGIRNKCHTMLKDQSLKSWCSVLGIGDDIGIDELYGEIIKSDLDRNEVRSKALQEMIGFVESRDVNNKEEN